MDHRPLTLNQQDSTTNQIPKFEFILTSSILAEWLNSHDLTPQQIISGRFYPKNNKLSLDLIQKSFPKDVPESSKNTLEEMIKLIKEWPRKLDKSNLTVYISTLLKYWLECYANGASIKVGLNLTNFLEFKLGFFQKRTINSNYYCMI